MTETENCTRARAFLVFIVSSDSVSEVTRAIVGFLGVTHFHIWQTSYFGSPSSWTDRARAGEGTLPLATDDYFVPVSLV